MCSLFHTIHKTGIYKVLSQHRAVFSSCSGKGWGDQEGFTKVIIFCLIFQGEKLVKTKKLVFVKRISE